VEKAGEVSEAQQMEILPSDSRLLSLSEKEFRHNKESGGSLTTKQKYTLKKECGFLQSLAKLSGSHP
jgi:hypothetical protein